MTGHGTVLCAAVAGLLVASCTGDPSDGPIDEVATGQDTGSLASDCPSVPDGLVGRQPPPQTVDLGANVKVTLEALPIVGGERRFARISGATIPGDLVWIDWTTNGGQSWLQCGPKTVLAPGRAVNCGDVKVSTGAPTRTRACGRLPPGPSRCTAWW